MTDSERKKVSNLRWIGQTMMIIGQYNNKALQAIFNECDVEHIKLISSCEMTKEAWKILQTMFEGSGDVKRNKLLSLTTQFENLRMHEDETLSDF